jgi:hypothetical protein
MRGQSGHAPRSYPDWGPAGIPPVAAFSAAPAAAPQTVSKLLTLRG